MSYFPPPLFSLPLSPFSLPSLPPSPLPPSTNTLTLPPFLLQIIAECSELQQELLAFRNERDELYKETQQQQALVNDLLLEKQRLEQDLDWMAKNGCDGYESLCRHNEEKPPPAIGKVE